MRYLLLKSEFLFDRDFFVFLFVYWKMAEMTTPSSRSGSPPRKQAKLDLDNTNGFDDEKLEPVRNFVCDCIIKEFLHFELLETSSI